MTASSAAAVVVAIDGPSGAGKSTVARRLARRLGVPFLDTGAMYRAVGLRVLQEGMDPGDRAAVEALAARTDVTLRARDDGSFEVLLEGAPVEALIRTPAVDAASSTVATHPAVRRRLVELQRAAARQFGGVLEGRDIGSRVFPDTPHKFFLDARPEVRAQRRHDQLAAAGRLVPIEQIRDEIRSRDQRDSTRADSPLTRDASYTYLDASDLDADAIVDRLATLIAQRAADPGEKI